MSIQLSDLQSACLFGGFIVKTNSENTARRAQAAGAVGIFIDSSQSDPSNALYRRIFQTVSIHSLASATESAAFLQSYREQYGSDGPGYYLLSKVNKNQASFGPEIAVLVDSVEEAQYALDSKPGMLVLSDEKLLPEIGHLRNKFRPFLPIFTEIETPRDAKRAIASGADGFIAPFVPSTKELALIFQQKVGIPQHREISREHCTIGVVALQGDYKLQQECLRAAAIEVSGSGHNPFLIKPIRTAQEVHFCDALVLPGGWSILQSILITETGLRPELQAFKASGKPILAICAGMVLSAARPGKDSRDRQLLGWVDVTINNNIHSGWHTVFLREGTSFSALFSNAPIAVDLGQNVQPLATLANGDVVAARDGNVTAAAYHTGGGLHETILRASIKSWRQKPPGKHG